MLAGSAADVDVSKLPPAATRPVDFTKDIQPIFEATCWNCHGPKKQESGFRLDNRAAALKGGEHGGDIVPGKSATSLLIHAVAGIHDEIKMPKKGEKLTPEQVGLLRAWIDQGALMPEKIAGAKDPSQHWAFKPPVKPAVAKVKDSKWTQNEIDKFILARLENEKLKPSPEAEKVTLLRRVSLDLIGLPPTPQEVDAFLADKSKDAYAKQIERLLASPHYGERWGRHWLDAARYADSDGYEKDMSREMWPYRDYVVNAFNRDLPYNQFIIEQIAGDQIPNAKQDQIVATGFLRNSMVNMEGAIDPEQFRMEAMFDRMDAIGKAVLGVTMQCAQCHNHKFDPISQEEYYRLFAFINNDHEARPVVYSPEQQMKLAELHRKISEIETDLKHRAPDWEKQMAAWEDSVKSNQPEWTVLPETSSGRRQGAALRGKGRRLISGLRLCADQDDAVVSHHQRSERCHGLPRGVADGSKSAVRRAGPCFQWHLRAQRIHGRGDGREADHEQGESEVEGSHARMSNNPCASWRRTSTTSPRTAAALARSSLPLMATTRRRGASTWARDVEIRIAKPCSSPKNRLDLRMALIGASACNKTTAVGTVTTT